MKYLSLLIAVLLLASSCGVMNKNKSMDNRNIYAWCIVPYDSLKRTPSERIGMLKRLGLKKYAYDWREEHLATTAEELRLARENNIEVIAVWLWIDDDWDKIGQLNPPNEKFLRILDEVGYHGQIWVSFNANYFDGLSDAAAVKKGADMIAYLNERAKGLGCKIALYNHGDWFGKPANQVKIIKALPDANLGIVYNFHHAKDQIEDFPNIVKVMKPYLWYVNLNGLKKGGPQILTIGEGDYEKGMISILKENGYKGDYGILGHLENADAEKVLKANLLGLEKITGR